METNKAEDIIQIINNLIVKHDLNVLDAIVHYAEKNNIEIESIASVIKSNSLLKQKLKNEAEDLNYIKRTTAKLPL